jgi:hypothetical protein
MGENDMQYISGNAPFSHIILNKLFKINHNLL